MTQKHATREDIIQILKARREATIEQVSIPALPQKQAPTITAQSLNAPATVPVVQPAPTPTVPDSDVEGWLTEYLPPLIKAAEALARPPFEFGEVVNLGVAVSGAVKAGLPQIKGQEARALVVVVTRHLWRTYAQPLLPAHIRPFAGLLEGLIIAGIEAGYQLLVKRGK